MEDHAHVHGRVPLAHAAGAEPVRDEAAEALHVADARDLGRDCTALPLRQVRPTHPGNLEQCRTRKAQSRGPTQKEVRARGLPS